LKDKKEIAMKNILVVVVAVLMLGVAAECRQKKEDEG
jgi:hypothetical protein